MADAATACRTCKARRIKCDGAMPICARCQKSRRTCIRAQHSKDSQFSIHLENDFASGTVKRPRGPRANYKAPRADVALELRAIKNYLDNFLLPKGIGEVGGLSECVRAWRASGRASDMVDLAISSMALAVFARTKNHHTAAKEALSKYHCLIEMVQERVCQMHDLDDDCLDAVLLSVYLMGRFEGTMLSQGKDTEHFPGLAAAFSHHDGVMALLKTWHSKSKDTSPSTIIKLTRRGQIRSSLIRNRPLPAWIEDGIPFGEHGLDLYHDRIMVRIVNVRNRILAMEENMVEASAVTDQLNVEVEDLCEALRTWASQLPPESHFQVYEVERLKNTSTRHFWSHTIHAFSSLANGSTWVQYCATMMLLASTRHRALKLYGKQISAEQMKRIFSANIDVLADSLAATVPFCLERFKVTDGLVTLTSEEYIKPHLTGLVVWSLTIASCLEGIRPEQQSWFRSELVELGRIVGDGMLQEAGSLAWIPLR